MTDFAWLASDLYHATLKRPAIYHWGYTEDDRQEACAILEKVPREKGGGEEFKEAFRRVLADNFEYKHLYWDWRTIMDPKADPVLSVIKHRFQGLDYHRAYDIWTKGHYDYDATFSERVGKGVRNLIDPCVAAIARRDFSYVADGAIGTIVFGGLSLFTLAGLAYFGFPIKAGMFLLSAAGMALGAATLGTQIYKIDRLERELMGLLESEHTPNQKSIREELENSWVDLSSGLFLLGTSLVPYRLLRSWKTPKPTQMARPIEYSIPRFLPHRARRIIYKAGVASNMEHFQRFTTNLLKNELGVSDKVMSDFSIAIAGLRKKMPKDASPNQVENFFSGVINWIEGYAPQANGSNSVSTALRELKREMLAVIQKEWQRV